MKVIRAVSALGSTARSSLTIAYRGVEVFCKGRRFCQPAVRFVLTGGTAAVVVFAMAAWQIVRFDVRRGDLNVMIASSRKPKYRPDPGPGRLVGTAAKPITITMCLPRRLEAKSRSKRTVKDDVFSLPTNLGAVLRYCFCVCLFFFAVVAVVVV